jgi:hypothetical protein
LLGWGLLAIAVSRAFSVGRKAPLGGGEVSLQLGAQALLGL